MTSLSRLTGAVTLILCGVTLAVSSVAADKAKGVETERVVIQSAAIAGNLEGNSAERRLIVYLPASYRDNPTKRYPVVYGLHGYTIDNEKWTSEIKAPETVNNAFAAGTKEMIIVLPDSLTLHNGSMYSSSVTTGDFESFIAKDVVAYVDAHYRTLAQPESRGLAGHSMGGYGTLRISMKHPGVFGAIYAMSPCCLSARGAPPPETAAKLEGLTSPEQSKSLGFMERATLAVASAWSPNPKKPPFYIDLPTLNGEVQPDVINRWTANAPLVMVHQYIGNMRTYKAIALDVGDRDGLKTDTEAMHKILSDYGVTNSYSLYDGDHVSGVADRFQHHVLPFFSQHLAFEALKPAKK